jgi:homoserine kinase type II
VVDAELWGVSGGVMTPAPHGTNNETYLVSVAGQPEWVLRVSQNLSTSQVQAEHRLLAFLSGAGLPFAVPSPAGLPDGTGTVAETAGGPAALYRWIPGVRPDFSDATALWSAGQAFGLLDAAMLAVPTQDAPQDWREDSQLSAELPYSDLLREAFAAVDVSGLPVQVVHGDMGASNMLVDPGTGAVTGVLDFAIAGAALRINELVAGLMQSRALSSGERWPALTAALVRGYCSACALTPAEIAAVPGLLLARAAGSVAWRASRWQRGVATRDEVEDRLRALDSLRGWLDSHGGALLDVLCSAS